MLPHAAEQNSGTEPPVGEFSDFFFFFKVHTPLTINIESLIFEIQYKNNNNNENFAN